jgi:rhodanese-related sulfurtransferase
LDKPSSPAADDSSFPDIKRISVEELKAKLDAGANIVIVDSQPDAYYKVTHIAGAISIPLETMAAPYTNLEGYEEIITVCN